MFRMVLEMTAVATNAYRDGDLFVTGKDGEVIALETGADLWEWFGMLLGMLTAVAGVAIFGWFAWAIAFRFHIQNPLPIRDWLAQQAVRVFFGLLATSGSALSAFMGFMMVRSLLPVKSILKGGDGEIVCWKKYSDFTWLKTRVKRPARIITYVLSSRGDWHYWVHLKGQGWFRIHFVRGVHSSKHKAAEAARQIATIIQEQIGDLPVEERIQAKWIGWRRARR